MQQWLGTPFAGEGRPSLAFNQCKYLHKSPHAQVGRLPSRLPMTSRPSSSDQPETLSHPAARAYGPLRASRSRRLTPARRPLPKSSVPHRSLGREIECSIRVGSPETTDICRSNQVPSCVNNCSSPALDARRHAEAVEFNLMEPLQSRRSGLHRLAELGRYPARKRRRRILTRARPTGLDGPSGRTLGNARHAMSSCCFRYGAPSHAALPERYDCPRSATSRAKSPAARTRQYVTVSGVVPPH